MMETSLQFLGKSGTKEIMEDIGIKGDLERIFGTVQISSDLFLVISFVLGFMMSLSISRKIGVSSWIVSPLFFLILWSFVSGLSYGTKFLIRGSSERIARSFIVFLSGFGRPLSLLYSISSFLGKGFTRILGKKGEAEVFTPLDSIEILVGDESMPEDKELKAEMIHGIFEISDKVVREIMVPRVDIVALDIRSSLDEILDTIIEEGYSRLPIYDGTIDNIVGLLYAKDLLGMMRSRGLIILQDIIRPAYFVPETKRITELFREFQRMRIHMAIVVDEYGGVAGLVTMEDIIEEIFGEIRDEYDMREEEMIEEKEDGRFIVDARCRVEELNRRIGARLPEREDIETIGGLIMDMFGEVPKVGRKIDIEDLEIVVVEADERRIRKVEVRRIYGER